MRKNIKDYLHLYLGCKVLFDNKKWILIRVGGNYCDLGCDGERCSIYPADTKLILRPLSDMTEEEAKEIYSLLGKHGNNKEWLLVAENDAVSLTDHELWLGYPEYWKYLLSKHFDLFGLCDAGLAIEKTTL